MPLQRLFPLSIISNSFSNQTLAQIELWTNGDNYENKVYVLPKHLDEKVARLHLAKIGELDELTTAQSEYLGISKEGPFKPESIIGINISFPCHPER